VVELWDSVVLVLELVDVFEVDVDDDVVVVKVEDVVVLVEVVEVVLLSDVVVVLTELVE